MKLDLNSEQIRPYRAIVTLTVEITEPFDTNKGDIDELNNRFQNKVAEGLAMELRKLLIVGGTVFLKRESEVTDEATEYEILKRTVQDQKVEIATLQKQGNNLSAHQKEAATSEIVEKLEQRIISLQDDLDGSYNELRQKTGEALATAQQAAKPMRTKIKERLTRRKQRAG